MCYQRFQAKPPTPPPPKKKPTLKIKEMSTGIGDISENLLHLFKHKKLVRKYLRNIEAWNISHVFERMLAAFIPGNMIQIVPGQEDLKLLWKWPYT